MLERRLNFRAEWLVLADNNHLDESGRSVKSTSDNNGRPPITTSPTPIKRQHTGVLGLVSGGRAWLSANGIMSTQDRRRDLLISEPFDSFRLHFLLSKSVRDHDHIFIKPFSPQAWAAILLSSLLVVPIFYLINTTSAHYYMADDKFFSRVSLMSCLRYLLSRSYNCLIECRRRPKRWLMFDDNRSRSSSTTSFDDQLDRMVLAGGAFNLEPQVVSYKSEDRRRKRLLKRRWLLERKQALRLGRMKRKSHGFFKLAYILWYVCASLAAQGGETEDLPLASSTRVLVAFWWLYLIVIVSIHSGILTAILTFPKQNDYIQTLDDYLALDQSERHAMRLTVDKSGELGHLLSNRDNLHKSPLQQLLAASKSPIAGTHHAPTTDYQDAQQVDASSTTIHLVDFQRHRERILDDVHRGQSAYMEERSTINLIITEEYFDNKPPKCQFKSSRYPIDIVPMSLVLSRKMSPVCLKTTNALLRQIMRTGLAQKWRRKYEPQGNDCLNTVIINAGDVQKIQLRHVMLAFWLLVAGLLVGAIFLIIEVVWLLTTDDDDDDDDDGSDGSDDSSSSSSLVSSCSSSDEAGDLRLGHRTTRLAHRSMRSLRAARTMAASLGWKTEANIAGGHLVHHHGALSLAEHLRVELPVYPQLDAIELQDGDEIGDMLDWTVVKQPETASEQQQVSKAERRRRRIQEKRRKRLKRTINLAKRLHEGKIYSARLFQRVSSKLHHNHLSHQQVRSMAQSANLSSNAKASIADGSIRRRRQNNNLCKVAPIL